MLDCTILEWKTAFYRYFTARTGPGKPVKSWFFFFIVAFSRTGKSLKKVYGPGTFWKSVKLK